MALPRNLWAGLRLSTFVPVQLRHFTASPRQVVLLAAVAMTAWILLDRLRIDGGAYITWSSVAEVVGVSALATAALVLIARRSAASGGLTELLTAVAAASPTLVLLGVLLGFIESEAPWMPLVGWVLPVMIAAVLYRAQRVATGEHPAGALGRAVVVVAGVWWLFDSALYGPPQFWFPEDEAEESADESIDRWTETERALFRQPDLIDAAVSRIRTGQRGVTEIYFVGFAGYGRQHVFDKEVRFARTALSERIDLDGRSLELINSPDTDGQTPFATVSGLRRALAGVAERMNLEEDVLVLFLSSHGGEDAELSVAQDVLPLEAMRGAELRDALDEAGIRWRIIVISACYSGSFIPHLEDPHTLVATASRSDRRSLGCSDERELTYFGEALFRDALPASEDFIDALTRARAVVQDHERQEKVAELERSEPQVFVGERMREKLSDLKFRRR